MRKTHLRSLSSTNKSKTKFIPELAQLEKIVGQFMVYWGFKEIHGRIWLNLYISTEALDTAELMSRLSVSKGLMSTAIRQLLEYKVIMPVQTGRHGTVFYEANPNLQEVIMGVLRSRESVMLDMTQTFATLLSKIPDQDLKNAKLSKQRIQSVQALTESAQTVLGSFLSMSSADDHFDFQNLFSACSS